MGGGTMVSQTPIILYYVILYYITYIILHYSILYYAKKPATKCKQHLYFKKYDW